MAARLLAAALAIVASASLAAFAQQTGDSLRDNAPPGMRAQFVFRVIQYVTWPPAAFPDAASPIVVAVLGDADLASALVTYVPGREVNGRSLTIRAVTSLSSLGRVHAVYLARLSAAELAAAAAMLSGPVLILTDTTDALENGSVVNFLHNGERFGFEVDVMAANARSLAVSAQLLTAALRVRKAAAPSSMTDPPVVVPRETFMRPFSR
jgi:hypothetical protein